MATSDRVIEILSECQEVEKTRRGPGDRVYFTIEEHGVGVTSNIVKSLEETNKDLGYLPTGNSREWRVIEL